MSRSPSHKLTELLNTLDVWLPLKSFNDFEVGGISCHSKKVREGDVFVAVKGSACDGQRFIDEAIQRGARAVILQGSEPQSAGRFAVPSILVPSTRDVLGRLASEFYGHPSTKMRVAGITGTNGKTTVSYLMEAMLKECGYLPAVVGTINYRFGSEVIPATNTTPGAVELQSLLADMVSGGIEYAIMEVSSHALDQKRTEGIHFHSALFTNITRDHLDYHKSYGAYVDSKARLFEQLPADAFAVINNDDPFAVRFKRATEAEVLTYGVEHPAQVRAHDIEFSLSKTVFTLTLAGARIRVHSPLLGIHNVSNVTAAAAWAHKAGIPIPVILAAVEKFSYIPGRLQRLDTDYKVPFYVFVDYAHTEDALRNSILALRRFSDKRLIVVFGCGGDRDKAKRPAMGRTASELSDYVVLTSDNPRREDPYAIIEDISKGIKRNNYCVIPERSEAIKTALAIAQPQDIVLVAGKGHEVYQIMKDRIVPFDDREEIRTCLRSMTS